MKLQTDKIASVESYAVYVLDGVTYVPHYLNESFYVGPAYDRTLQAYSPDYLTQQGAVKQYLHLWKRGTTTQIKNIRWPV